MWWTPLAALGPGLLLGWWLFKREGKIEISGRPSNYRPKRIGQAILFLLYGISGLLLNLNIFLAALAIYFDFEKEAIQAFLWFMPWAL